MEKVENNYGADQIQVLEGLEASVIKIFPAFAQSSILAFDLPQIPPTQSDNEVTFTLFITLRMTGSSPSLSVVAHATTPETYIFPLTTPVTVKFSIISLHLSQAIVCAGSIRCSTTVRFVGGISIL